MSIKSCEPEVEVFKFVVLSVVDRPKSQTGDLNNEERKGRKFHILRFSVISKLVDGRIQQSHNNILAQGNSSCNVRAQQVLQTGEW